VTGVPLWVKVCGVRRRVDVAAAEEAGANAVGLVLADSPRRVTPEEAARLAAATDLETFIVTVDAHPAELLDLASFTGVTGVQPHGAGAEEAAAAAVRAGLTVLRPVRVDGPVDFDRVPARQIPLLDSPHVTLHGGTGSRFDPDLVPPTDRRWVLAGGMGPGTVGEAVARLRPWGVDASSALESRPGVKDPDLIMTYVEEARQA
jgi:phosphoribosylanthranilate isomerase